MSDVLTDENEDAGEDKLPAVHRHAGPIPREVLKIDEVTDDPQRRQIKR